MFGRKKERERLLSEWRKDHDHMQRMLDDARRVNAELAASVDAAHTANVKMFHLVQDVRDVAAHYVALGDDVKANAADLGYELQRIVK